MKYIYLLFFPFLLGCYGINKEGPSIAIFSPECLDSLAWESMCKEYPIDNIKNPDLLYQLEQIRANDAPKYILYFKEEPEEIIGCSGYSIDVAYNAEISSCSFNGGSVLLSNYEQKRIRNRVFKAMLKYQCEQGKMQTLERMKEDVLHSDLHKDYPLEGKRPCQPQ